MNADMLTHASTELINNALRIAKTAHHSSLTALHILKACLQNDFCHSVFKACSVEITSLELFTKKQLEKLPTVSNSTVVADQSFEQFYHQARKEAQHLGDAYVSLEHWMLAFSIPKILPVSFKDHFKHYIHKRVLKVIESLSKGKRVESKTAETAYQALEKYCQNITQQAKDGHLDPVIGRHEEIRRVIQILSRRTKNNPVLVGQPGVGKTAIVEGIAQRIINNDVPQSLADRQIYALDLGLLIAGAKYQGEFEDRIKSVLKEIEQQEDNVILFIDELHMLIGTGKSSGSGMDASNLLKPALARGKLHCIGATTFQEYKQYIEKDAALERRFQQVSVEEPSIEDAISILRGLKERYETHHGISIKDQALVEAVVLSDKYITQRFLPDKAIDLVDEAAAMIKMAIDSHPEQIDQYERKIRQLEIERVALQKETDVQSSQERLGNLEGELSNYKQKHTHLLDQWKAERLPLDQIAKINESIENAQTAFQQAEREGDYSKASEIKYGTIARLEQERKEKQAALSTIAHAMIKQSVDEHDIAHVLSKWTGIAVQKLTDNELHRLLCIDKILKERVIGQDQAIDALSTTIITHRAGLVDPYKPIGSFMFLGPTGVGKTEVAKACADYLFNDERKLIRIDMSEYMEPHAVARLIGAPPGYVGYEQGGQLTEQVKRNPYSVILFDEIEKAHSEVFNIFLQLLDEGHLTNGQGVRVSFKNCIIIMTSNIGSELILSAQTINQELKDHINVLLHKQFKPEFLNRIDAFLFFNKLTQPDVAKIALLQINTIIKRLDKQSIKLSVDDEVIILLASEGYDADFGARPLKRIINQRLTAPLSHFILRHPAQKNIHVTINQETITIA